MARIRTIKPEFPQSESMGNVSRDARLLFIMLWPICDDHGRTRAASRMLASTLFPYDDDAGKLIDGWLDELEREKCIKRYHVNGSTYLEICNWLIHQKIDKPTASKLPPFVESSRAFAKPREDSSGDRDQGSGSRIKDQDHGGVASDRLHPSKASESDQASRAHALPDPHEVLEKVKAVYPAGLHRGDHWLLAEREISRLLDAGETPDSLIRAATEYAAQQMALGKLGTSAVMRPSNFFNGTGAWRGPFPLPQAAPKSTDRITWRPDDAAAGGA